jgi:hypothetical protein
MILFQNGAFHFASTMIRLDTERSSLDQVIIGHSMICCYGKSLFPHPHGEICQFALENTKRIIDKI